MSLTSDKNITFIKMKFLSEKKTYTNVQTCVSKYEIDFQSINPKTEHGVKYVIKNFYADYFSEDITTF